MRDGVRVDREHAHSVHPYALFLPLASDINLLLVGDPSTAKSQMLRYERQIVLVASNCYGLGTAK